MTVKGERLLNCIKFIIYILFSILVLFFIKNVFQQYLKHTTSISRSQVKISHHDSPVITICSDVGFKLSKLKQHTLSMLDIWLESKPVNSSSNVSLWHIFNESSFILDREFKMTLFNMSNIEEFKDGIKLHHGKNYLKKYNSDNEYLEIKVEAIPTIHFGMCYSIIPKFTIG